jgi:hypothetical protein
MVAVVNFPALSDELFSSFVQAAKHIKDGQGMFLEVYRRACIYFGSEDWIKSNYEQIFLHVRKQITPKLRQEPICWDTADITKHCSGAERCLMTGAPWKFYSTNPKTLKAAHQIVKEDNRPGVSIKTKWDNAISRVQKEASEARARAKEEDRLLNSTQEALISLPMRSPGEDAIAFRVRVIERIKMYMETPAVRDDLKGDDMTATVLKKIHRAAVKALSEATQPA